MKKYTYDFTDLKLLILKQYGTIKNFCEKTNFNATQVSRWFVDGCGMTVQSVDNLCSLLKIKRKDIPNYFFVHKVNKTEDSSQ